MRIGIITFHRAVNYGAVLQAYALCKSIRTLGHDCEIIDYRSRFIEDYYDSRKLLLPRNWKRLISYILNNGNLKPNKELFASFLRENHVLSNTIYYDNSELSKCEENYDFIITGSDQVWNYATAGFDKAYFLDFLHNAKKKRSYAASFGLSEIPKEYIGTYSKLLKDYTTISVREKAGEKIVHDILNIPVTVDLDPTLLLDKGTWKTLTVFPKDFQLNSSNRYILVYTIGEDQRIINIAKEVALKEKMEVVYITDRWRNSRGVINLRSVTPCEWLGLFDKADYIVTNSFHGSAFSVNFEKKFVVLGNNEGKKKASRIETLLADLSLRDRFTYNQDEAKRILCNNIDYDIVTENLRTRRHDSIQNLVEALK